MDVGTQQLDLTAPIATGNIKAAAAAAGATSADLWMVPYDHLHYDPADNIRPVDPEWVAHLTALILANGYDKGSPLHCYARKVDGKDLLFVYKGQHRYLAAGKAIEAGAKLEKIPVVVREAKTVNRAEMVIDGVVSNEGMRSSLLDLAAAIAELRDIHGMTIATICRRLNITDQTVRDVALLERAPAELHQMVRDGKVAGTLAIEQIREHGAENALDRLQKGAAKAAASGKVRVTKKHLTAATARPKISEQQSKRLLQALQSVLHDPCFGKLSPGTIEGVHRALTGMEDLLDLPKHAEKHPVHRPNANGVFEDCEKLHAPKATGSGLVPASIYIAHAEPGAWIYSFEMNIAPTYGFGDHLPSMRETPAILPTRVQAIRAAVADVTRLMHHSERAKSKAAASVNKWLDKLYTMPDPDWTAEMAKEASK
ncbi:pyridoxal phosphate biosynthetic protein PdxJ [Burkholderia sp. AU16482]|uniref:ParB/RepB/Spo0J family partition protein n=1 Tax=Burkholderia sp. AU16482 TaxID=2015346 RepID=UPI000B7A91B9|nr:pyridoxal phosphate biosynthetic protein PdxJ [Burkholderia sp. AU16482]OXI26883.1 pyridoxal phosphate biosynthetic protein PdxJ [Burkholderia sp. AU16482]